MRSNTISFLIFCLALSQITSRNLKKDEAVPSAEEELIEKIKQGIDVEANFELLKKINDEQEKEIKESVDPEIEKAKKEAEIKKEEAEKSYEQKIEDTIEEHKSLVEEKKELFDAKIEENDIQLDKTLKKVDEQAELNKIETIAEIEDETKEKIKEVSNESIEHVLEIQSLHTDLVSEGHQNYIEKAEEIDDEAENNKDIVSEIFDEKGQKLKIENDTQEETAKCSLKINELKSSVQDKIKELKEIQSKIDELKKQKTE